MPNPFFLRWHVALPSSYILELTNRRRAICILADLGDDADVIRPKVPRISSGYVVIVPHLARLLAPSHIIVCDKSLKTMTSVNLSKTEEWRAAIDTDGYICLDDSAVGLRVEEFAKKGWPRTNLEGLKFLKEHTLDDEVMKQFELLQSFVWHSSLAHCRDPQLYAPWL